VFSAKGILDASICDTLSHRSPKSQRPGLHFEADQIKNSHLKDLHRPAFHYISGTHADFDLKIIAEFFSFVCRILGVKWSGEIWAIFG